MKLHLFAFGIAFLGVINATNAGCPDGAEKPCTINGKRGHQVCAGGGYGPCVPDEEATPHPTAASPTPAYDLTGTYTADDGGVYYVRQAGNVLWWAGMSTESDLGVLDFHKGLQFTNVFRGTISGYTIDGEWADVPRGRLLQSGRLVLRFSYLGSVSASFVKTSANPPVRASRWTKRIVINSNSAACENASSANIVCKFDRVTKSNGGTLLHGGDLLPYKDNVVIFGQVHNRAKLEEEDGDFDFDMAVERVNWSATGLDQLSGFWTEGWLQGSNAIGAKLDRHNNNAHVEVIRYGSTGSDGSGSGAILLPGWAQSGANSVLVNGQPVNGNVASTVLEADIGGHYLGPSSPSMRVRVMGVLVLDCGHGVHCNNPLPPDPSQMGVEIHPVYSIDILNEPFGAPRPGSSGTLTGAWAANDEGTYYLRQVNNSVWWLGLSRDRGGSFANVFHGTIQGNTVAGDWADVPIGSVRNSGRLTLLGAGGGASTTKLAKDAGASTPGFGGQLWEKLYDQPPKWEMAVTIRGNGAITVPLDPGETSADSAAGEYRIVTQDLRPPLQIVWTASSGSNIENPNGASTRITFDIAGTRPGQTVRKGVAVHVTDADNRSAQSRLGISIRVITQREPPKRRP